nr:unnamed protein product [Digitaria exilis]
MSKPNRVSGSGTQLPTRNLSPSTVFVFLPALHETRDRSRLELEGAVPDGSVIPRLRHRGATSSPVTFIGGIVDVQTLLTSTTNLADCQL